MKVGRFFGFMFGLVVAGLSHGESKRTSVSYHLEPSSLLAQAFFKSGALVWDPTKSGYHTLVHGFFPSTSNEGGLLVECWSRKFSGGGRGGATDVEDGPGKVIFMGCDITKKGPAAPIEAPVLTLEDLIVAQVAKK